MRYIRTFEKFELNSGIIDAIENGDIELVKKLIKDGINLNKKYKDGYTALIMAVTENNIEIVKLLIDAGVNLDKKDEEGFTALHHAIWNNIEIVKLLINAGANLNLKDRNRETPLMMSLYVNRDPNGNNIELIRLLLDSGADINIKNEDNNHFFVMLNDRDRNEIIRLYPEKYEEYKMKKNAEKYNI